MGRFNFGLTYDTRKGKACKINYPLIIASIFCQETGLCLAVQ